MSPASRRTTPPRTFTSVDLPAPFSPISARTSPGRRDRFAVAQRLDGAIGLARVAQLDDRGARRSRRSRSWLTDCGRSTWSLLRFRPKEIKTERSFRVKTMRESVAFASQFRLTNRTVRDLVDPRTARSKRRKGIKIARKRSEGGRNVLAETRRREITESLRSSGSVTVAEVEARFSVSPVTARRDLDELERRGVLRRTHGGGVLPTTSAHEDSFARRLKVAAEAKRRLAEEAVALMAPGETVFLDSSTTSYFVARRIIETGIATTVLTNSFPVMELIFNEGSSAEHHRRRRQPAAADALVRRPVRGADRPGPLRRPALPQRQGPHRRRDDDRRRRARGRGQAHDDRPGRRVDAARRPLEDAGARPQRDRLRVRGLQRHRPRPLDRRGRGAQGRARLPAGARRAAGRG